MHLEMLLSSVGSRQRSLRLILTAPSKANGVRSPTIRTIVSCRQANRVLFTCSEVQPASIQWRNTMPTACGDGLKISPVRLLTLLLFPSQIGSFLFLRGAG